MGNWRAMSDPLAVADQSASGYSCKPAESTMVSCPRVICHSIEVRVSDEKQRPVRGIATELRRGTNDALRNKTDGEGAARFDGLAAGSYQLSLPDLDEDLWQTLNISPIPSPPAAPASWEKVNPSPSPAALKSHLIEPGDCVVFLSDKYGVPPEVIWGHAANAGLRIEGRVLEILEAAKTIMIPPVRTRWIEVQADSRVVLLRKNAMAEINIRFLDADDQPRHGLQYGIRLFSTLR